MNGAILTEDEIALIISKYPESDWLTEIKKKFPNADMGYALSVIEVLCGGDIVQVSEKQ